MNLWWWIYVLAGSGAICTLFLAIAIDLDRLAGWVRGLREYPKAHGRIEFDHVVSPPPVQSRGLYALVLAILVVLWITAAVIR